MDKLHAILAGVSITLGVGLLFSLVIPYMISLQDREGARPRDGIVVVRSNHIDINSMSFYVVTRDEHYIEVRMSTSPNISPLKEGILGIYFPYKVELDREHMADFVDYTNWIENNDYEYGTAFVRNFPCVDKTECNLYANDQVVFNLKPNEKFDSKNIFRHNIKLKFDNTAGEPRDFFHEFEDSRNLNYTIDTSSQIQATVIIPEIADNLHTLPIPEPDMFHNSGYDYSNTQLNWPITKKEHVFFVDYEMPDERKTFEIQQIIITAIGVGLGLTAIPISIYSLKKKVRFLNHKNNREN